MEKQPSKKSAGSPRPNRVNNNPKRSIQIEKLADLRFQILQNLIVRRNITVHFEPQKSMGGFFIDIQKKSHSPCCIFAQIAIFQLILFVLLPQPTLLFKKYLLNSLSYILLLLLSQFKYRNYSFLLLFQDDDCILRYLHTNSNLINFFFAIERNFSWKELSKILFHPSVRFIRLENNFIIVSCVSPLFSVNILKMHPHTSHF